MRPLSDGLNRQSLDDFLPEQTLTLDESMVPYLDKHGAKQYINRQPIKYGYKMWVIATPWGYAIQLYLHQGAGTSDKVLVLGGSVVSNLISCLPREDRPMYHIAYENFFTSFVYFSTCWKLDLQALEHQN